ncbi:MAG: HyaD/HybD family hydrogenase maturation endopeptidase [Candidatus Saccharicenans sp.]|jgi:hydrogenase maturation protease|nr:HyaD/HybD family hydrogenase maturation endopeptidase [Candidatus Saccharicenans sp.]MDH7492673.1 HyaD/HybD family hydrogenase maturation endopeptidase [Candidatus Saccharicenans sp.]
MFGQDPTIKAEAPRQKKIMVLGLGNILNHDEGAGVYALKELQQIAPAEIKSRAELIDGGVLGMDLLPYVERATHLLILDAVDGGFEPGQVLEYENDEMQLFYHGRISWHQLGFQEVLAMAKVRGKFPEEVHLIGVQPKDISTGLGLSVEMKKAVREMARRGLEVLMKWLEET